MAVLPGGVKQVGAPKPHIRNVFSPIPSSTSSTEQCINNFDANFEMEIEETNVINTSNDLLTGNQDHNYSSNTEVLVNCSPCNDNIILPSSNSSLDLT